MPKVDVQGKIVLCLSGVPEFLPGNVTNQYATLRQKAEVAKKHGAVGLVCINLSETCRSYEVQHQAYCGEGSHQATFPVVQPTMDMGRALLENEQMTLDSVIDELQNKLTPQSFHLRKKFEININAKYRPDAPTANVIGYLPGHDDRMKHELVVVGAHLDHVGMQGSTCLFPGADCNASGVAAVLETARLLTTYAPKDIEYNKRSVVFVLFSGGELENLGSLIFVSNFSKLKNIECFINAQCIGSGDSINVMGNKRFPQPVGDCLPQRHRFHQIAGQRAAHLSPRRCRSLCPDWHSLVGFHQLHGQQLRPCAQRHLGKHQPRHAHQERQPDGRGYIRTLVGRLSRPLVPFQTFQIRIKKLHLTTFSQ